MIKKNHQLGNFSGGLVVRICVSNAEDTVSIPGWGNPHGAKTTFLKKLVSGLYF